MNKTNSCSLNPSDHQNVQLGIFYICHSLFYTIVYLPCAIAIFTKPLNEIPCYQIMGGMAILDLIELFWNVISGCWSIIGLAYCSAIWNQKVFFAFVNAFWIAYCAVCITLAYNRLLETSSPGKAERLFSNGKTYYWLAGCISWGLVYFIIFITPYAGGVYNGKIGVFMFDQHSGTELGGYCNTFNNIITLSLLIILYGRIFIHTKQVVGVIENDQMTTEELNVIKIRRAITTQCVCICLAATITCLFYTTVPMITTKTWAFVLITIFWQMTHGANCIIYLSLNKAIRDRVKTILGCSTGNEVIPIATGTKFNGHGEL